MVGGGKGAGVVDAEVIECCHIYFCGFLFSGRGAVGDGGLYYVLCDKGCPTADRGCNPVGRWG
jgi:hypothetical protein